MVPYGVSVAKAALTLFGIALGVNKNHFSCQRGDFLSAEDRKMTKFERTPQVYNGL